MTSPSISKKDLERLYRSAVTAAGPRYTPDANVDVPIRRAFEALLRSPSFFDDLDRRTRDLDRSGGYLLDSQSPVAQLAEFSARIRRIARRCTNLVKRLRAIPRDPVAQLPLRRSTRSARELEAAADHLGRELYERMREVPGGEGADDRKRLLESMASRVNSVRAAADDVADLCGGPYARATNRGALLLVGEAGQGKTHLFCDLAKHALDEDRPAILLMGQHFRPTGDVWSQVSSQIGIRGLTGQAALKKLEFLGSKKKRRALLMIDALNEGGGLGLWPIALAQLIKAVRAYPHVVLAVSCRTSYVKAVVRPSVERRLVRFEHQGFAGIEADAAARFFSNYGLRHPAIPILSPEFSRPLFLKLFCEGLRGREAKTAPSGHRGMTDVLEDFARSVGRRIVRDLGNRAQTKLPWECLKDVASRMAQLGRDSLDRPDAESIVNARASGKLPAADLFQKMVDEGLLAEDLRYENGKPVGVIRFPYQQFSDHLIARYLLRHHLDRARPGNCFRPGGGLAKLVADRPSIARYSGILEALAVQIPEWANSELLDLVPDRRHDELYRAHIKSIVWRKPDKFPDEAKTIRYLNEASRNRWLLSETWDALLTVAAVPGHPLNARRLHTSLLQKPLPVRDEFWTRHLHDSWDAGSSVDRYLEWSDTVDAKSLPDEPLLLAAIALTWFLTSSNRFIRDRSTKALVRILAGRFGVIEALLDRFQSVNDVYVVERLLSAAYGCAVLSADAPAVASLARKVHKQYLSGANRQRHILVRDYAEGIVLRAKTLAPLRLRTVRPIQKPLRLHPPTRQRLAARYQKDRDYGDIWYSVMGQDDFDRYVIERTIRQFTGYRLSEATPPKRPEAPTGDPTLMTLLFRQLKGEALTDEDEAALERRAKRRVPKRDPKEQFDVDLARRWILRRVLALGWTPERFLDFDRMVNYRDTREARKPERIGKKYQWIALHELLGLLADNYRWHSGFDSHQAGRCPGGWAMDVRDIDPTHLPMARPSGRVQAWWQPLRQELTAISSSELLGWIKSRRWPDPKRLILVTDPHGSDWLVTDGYYTWSDSNSDAAGEDRYPYRTLWYQVRCYLVRAAHAEKMRNWLADQNFMGRWMPESVSHHGDFIGEYPWHPSTKELKQGWTRGWRGDHRPPVPVLIPAASLAWDDSYDASIKESYSGLVPAAWLVPELRSSWRPPFDYVSQAGTVVACDPSWHSPGPHVGLVRRKEIEAVCKRLGLVPFWTLLGEKQVIEGFGGPHMPWREVSGAFEVNGDQVVGATRQKLGVPRN